MHVWRLLVCTLFTIVALPGCGLLLDLDPGETPIEPRPYLCEADIFREIGSSEFTESWQGWVFAADETAGDALCRLKLAEYVSRSMAPGFAWQMRGLRITEGNPTHPDPLLRKESASECPADDTGPPFTVGGPRGADLILEQPVPEQASVLITATAGGTTYFADPPVRLLVWRLAERHGRPGTFPPFDYRRTERHLRSSDLFLEVDTPFDLGDVRIDKLYLQAVGTLYASEGLGGEWFLETGPRAKVFFYGRGHRGDDERVTSFCITGQGAPLFASQGPVSPGFGFTLILSSEDMEGLPMSIVLGLGAPPVIRVPADRYQPFVRLAGRETSALAPNLGDAVGDVIHDNDGDLTRVLWFTDFETGSERLLGEGLPFRARFSPGPHEVTAVAYDTRGAYNFATAMIRVLQPVAVDDVFTTDEDTPLAVPPPGVLANDTDAGVLRIAQLVSGPSHGLVTFGPDGSFLYAPSPNFFGTDVFTYRVDHDGLAVTNTANVTITVVELTPQEEADRLADMCSDLLASGALTEGQAVSCRATLDGASDDLDRGSVLSACNKLAAFVNHLISLVRAGELTAEEAQPLLDRANNVRAELGCPVKK